MCVHIFFYYLGSIGQIPGTYQWKHQTCSQEKVQRRHCRWREVCWGINCKLEHCNQSRSDFSIKLTGWDKNNYCLTLLQNWASSQNDNFFHSKCVDGKSHFWANCHFVNLSVLSKGLQNTDCCDSLGWRRTQIWCLVLLWVQIILAKYVPIILDRSSLFWLGFNQVQI